MKKDARERQIWGQKESVGICVTECVPSHSHMPRPLTHPPCPEGTSTSCPDTPCPEHYPILIPAVPVSVLVPFQTVAVLTPCQSPHQV